MVPKGSRGNRQLLQRTANTTVWTHITMLPSVVYHPTSLSGGLITLERQVQLIENEDRQHNIYSVDAF